MVANGIYPSRLDMVGSFKNQSLRHVMKLQELKASSRCLTAKGKLLGAWRFTTKTERKMLRYNGQCQVVAVKASGLFDLDCTLSAS